MTRRSGSNQQLEWLAVMAAAAVVAAVVMKVEAAVVMKVEAAVMGAAVMAVMAAAVMAAAVMAVMAAVVVKWTTKAAQVVAAAASVATHEPSQSTRD